MVDKEHEFNELHSALTDALSGWEYIREQHGDLYGVGWDRVEQKLKKQISINAKRIKPHIGSE